MKRRIILALASIMVFGLAIATVAFSSGNNASTTAAAACCCCSGDSCPLKSKAAAVTDASLKDKASCCDGCEHCSGGAESCPMMKDAAHKGEHAKGANSCCPMMKDASLTSADKTVAAHGEKAGAVSCPMKDKMDAKSAAETTGAEPVAAKDKTSCNCACCAGHADKQTVPAV